MIVQIEIPDAEKDKETLLRLLAEEDTKVVATAYLYAINLVRCGVDVTKEWDTATKQSYALSKAHHDGYRKGYSDGYDAGYQHNKI